MRFEPKSEEEVLNLLIDGIYAFRVSNAVDSYSQKGDEIIKLELAIDKGGYEKIVKCTLTPAFMVLVKHFCDATDLHDVYKTGELSASHCFNKTGYAKVIIDKNEGTGYAPCNRIRDFVVMDSVGNKPQLESKPNQESAQPAFSDEIPF